jgi:hypothetical protein
MFCEIIYIFNTLEKKFAKILYYCIFHKAKSFAKITNNLSLNGRSFSCFFKSRFLNFAFL